MLSDRKILRGKMFEAFMFYEQSSLRNIKWNNVRKSRIQSSNLVLVHYALLLFRFHPLRFHENSSIRISICWRADLMNKIFEWTDTTLMRFRNNSYLEALCRLFVISLGYLNSIRYILMTVTIHKLRKQKSDLKRYKTVNSLSRKIMSGNLSM